MLYPDDSSGGGGDVSCSNFAGGLERMVAKQPNGTRGNGGTETPDRSEVREI